MFPKNMFRKSLRHLRAAFVTSIVFQLALGGPLAASLQAQQAPPTRTPIKHVIVIIGENRTFDHIFATYKPKKGEKVDNLLSKEIINADGTPGPQLLARRAVLRAGHEQPRIPGESDGQDSLQRAASPAGWRADKCTAILT